MIVTQLCSLLTWCSIKRENQDTATALSERNTADAPVSERSRSVRAFHSRLIVGPAIFACAFSTQAMASEQMMEQSGCLSCHRVEQKILGPSFKDIAARYKGHPEVVPKLMQKVREGGEGEWGDVPMSANTPEKISDENLKQVIDWILSL